MEAKKTTFTLGTPEEVRAWFYRAKARIAAREEEIRAMYKEEQLMKAEALYSSSNGFEGVEQIV